MSSLRLKERRKGPGGEEAGSGGPAGIRPWVSEPHLHAPSPPPESAGEWAGQLEAPQGNGLSSRAYLGRDGKCD